VGLRRRRTGGHHWTMNLELRPGPKCTGPWGKSGIGLDKGVKKGRTTHTTWFKEKWGKGGAGGMKEGGSKGGTGQHL